MGRVLSMEDEPTTSNDIDLIRSYQHLISKVQQRNIDKIICHLVDKITFRKQLYQNLVLLDHHPIAHYSHSTLNQIQHYNHRNIVYVLKIIIQNVHIVSMLNQVMFSIMFSSQSNDELHHDYRPTKILNIKIDIQTIVRSFQLKSFYHLILLANQVRNRIHNEKKNICPVVNTFINSFKIMKNLVVDNELSGSVNSVMLFNGLIIILHHNKDHHSHNNKQMCHQQFIRRIRHRKLFTNLFQQYNEQQSRLLIKLTEKNTNSRQNSYFYI